MMPRQVHPDYRFLTTAKILVKDELRFAEKIATMHTEENGGILMAGFISYLSMLTYEQWRHVFGKESKMPGDPTFSVWMQHGRNFAKELKAESSTQKSIRSISVLLEEQRQAWSDVHAGRKLESLWRRIQTDMGIYFYRDRFLTSTTGLSIDTALPHSEILNLISTGDNPDPFRNFGEILGYGLGRTAAVLGLPRTSVTVPPAVSSITFEDVKSSKSLAFVTSRWPGLSEEIVAALLSMLGRLRVWTLLAHTVSFGPNDLAAAKIKFLAVYSVARRIESILRWSKINGGIPESLGMRLRVALASPAVSSVRSQGELRNLLVHYGDNRLHGSPLITDRHYMIREFSEYGSVPIMQLVTDRALEDVDAALDSILESAWVHTRNWKAQHQRTAKEQRERLRKRA